MPNGQMCLQTTCLCRPIQHVDRGHLGDLTSHCVSLQHIWLPTRWRHIRKEAFMFCNALTEVDVPPTLRYIAHLAFFDCGQLARFTLMGHKNNLENPMQKTIPSPCALASQFQRGSISSLLTEKTPPDMTGRNRLENTKRTVILHCFTRALHDSFNNSGQ